MAEDLIRYDVLAQEAMRSVVKKVLTEVVRVGLPGEHHFYITFNTQAPGVRISSRLRERYPEEMTIVVQHQFWDLEVNSQSFEIGLAFSGVPERLLVPFGSIKSFVDPSVQFGLQFDLLEEEHISEELTEDNDTSSTALGAAAPTALAVASEDHDEAIEAEQATEAALEATKDQADAEPKDDSSDDEPSTADVVSLDAFRKKAE
ncbi:MAG: ClpXP protease specificity-enhancing factor SspB [Hyphomicrobiales bacterium]